MHALIDRLMYVELSMDCRIDAHIARTQFGQIMDLATKTTSASSSIAAASRPSSS
jgi:hypothetical protein